MGANARSLPVLDGRIKPDGITFQSTVLHPSEIFWRQLKFAEFDVSEMSLSSLLIAVASGNRDWVGIPVFTSRTFFHARTWVRTDSGIEKPEDLRGKRVGVPEYQQTAALWNRGALLHEFGVKPTEIEWFMERNPERSHGGATGFKPPPGVKLSYIPMEKNIGTMMISGELDATLMYLPENNLVDRSSIPFEGRSDVRPLFRDRGAEGRRYFAKTGLYPINHGMVVRRSIVEKHPWVVLNIFNAFRTAKDNWLREAKEGVQPHIETGILPPEAAKALSRDPYPYGVVANRNVLETIARYSHEQGLTPRVLGLDEVFAPNTLEV
jgi:4,5-dihydroxyphthalate decarboxylase